MGEESTSIIKRKHTLNDKNEMIPAIGPKTAVFFVLAVFVLAVFVLAVFVLAVFVLAVFVLAVFVLAVFVLAFFVLAVFVLARARARPRGHEATRPRGHSGATGFGRQCQIPYVFPFEATRP